jgi:hypothetical protein
VDSTLPDSFDRNLHSDPTLLLVNLSHRWLLCCGGPIVRLLPIIAQVRLFVVASASGGHRSAGGLAAPV